MLRIKYKSSMGHGFREENGLYVLPIESIWELMSPGVGPFCILGASLEGSK